MKVQAEVAHSDTGILRQFVEPTCFPSSTSSYLHIIKSVLTDWYFIPYISFNSILSRYINHQLLTIYYRFFMSIFLASLFPLFSPWNNLAPHPPLSGSLETALMSTFLSSSLCVASWDVPALAWIGVKGGANTTGITKNLSSLNFLVPWYSLFLIISNSPMCTLYVSLFLSFLSWFSSSFACFWCLSKISVLSLLPTLWTSFF